MLTTPVRRAKEDREWSYADHVAGPPAVISDVNQASGSVPGKGVLMKILSTLLVSFMCLFSQACSGTTGAPQHKEPGKGIAGENEVIVTYIANEGVLVSSGGHQVLIDGLHRRYSPAYAFPPDGLREKLENARRPYDDIDLVLVSHFHGDHFHAESVGMHLLNNPKAKLASSPQVVNSVLGSYSEAEKIKTRAIVVKHEWKRSEDIEINGVKVRFLGLRHGSERFKAMENLGHLIEVGGKKFLHIGDADMTAENFAVHRLAEENIDVAFIPFWFLQSAKGRGLVEKLFSPKNIIAVHISPSDASKVKADLESRYKDITVFTEILQSKTF